MEHEQNKTRTKSPNDEFECSRFANRLHKLAAAAELSQSDIASLMGVSRSAVSFWFKGENYPQVIHIKRLAAILHTTPEYLLFGSVSTHSQDEDSFPVINRGATMALPPAFMPQTKGHSLKALAVPSLPIGDLTLRADHEGIILIDDSDRDPSNIAHAYAVSDGNTVRITSARLNGQGRVRDTLGSVVAKKAILGRVVGVVSTVD